MSVSSSAPTSAFTSPPNRPGHASLLNAQPPTASSATTHSSATTGLSADSSAQHASDNPALIELPSPLVPAVLTRSVSSLSSSLSDLSSGLDSLSHGRWSAAVSNLSRVCDIVARMNDPYALIAVQRLLAAAYHEAGEWSKESAVRAGLLDSGAVQWPASSADSLEAEDERLLLFQHASSYIALQRLRSESADLRSLHALLDAAASDDNLTWRANARALQVISRQPVDNAASGQQVADLEQALEWMERAAQQQPSRHQQYSSHSPLTRLLHIGDLHCMLAEHHTNRGDKQQARHHYEQCQQYWDKQRSQHNSPLPLMRGGAQVTDVWSLCGVGLSSRAVQQTEEQLGPSHPSLAVSLRLAALQQQSDGEPILAEGLLRSSIGQLEAHISQPARTAAIHVATADLRVELVNAQWQYAQLLSRLEWNGKTRQAEAEHWLRKVDETIARHGYLKPQRHHLQQMQSEQRTATSATSLPRWLVERLSI